VDSVRLVLLGSLMTAALAFLMVVATAAARVLRTTRRRRLQARRQRLEPALYQLLETGRRPRFLRRLRGRDLEVLTALVVELLAALRGAQRHRLVALASDLGLVERDLRRLGSRRYWERARAAEQLGHYGQPELVRPLADLLDDDEETVRVVAARALSRLATAEAATALAEHLSSTSELTGLRMAENLERIGPLTVEPLTALLDSTDDADRRGQVLAARILGNLRVSMARPALRRVVVRRRNTDLRAQATLALGMIGDPHDVPILVEAAGDSSWPVRVQAANALGMIGDISTVGVLEHLCADVEWWMRVSASQSLSNMGAAGQRALLRLVESSDRFVRERAAATLEARGVGPGVVDEVPLPGTRPRRARAAVRSATRWGSWRDPGRPVPALAAEDGHRTTRGTMATSHEP
jgi:HEAT repeat protein